MRRKSFLLAIILVFVASTVCFANDDIKTFMAGGKLRTVKPLEVEHYIDYLATQPRPVVKANLPAYFNWHDKDGKDWMSPVRDQASCGSCWTFGALAAMEGAIDIYLNDPDFDIDLSEQFMVSCGGGSCENGGFAEEVLAKLQSDGIPDEACYEYLAEEGLCSNACSDWQERTVKICDWNILVAPTEEELKSELLNGPMPVTMRVDSGFSGYSGGVWEGSYTNCGFFEDQTNHVVALVGWNDANDTWIVKNSWGDDWGDGGYFHAKRGTSCVGTFSANWLRVDVPTVPGVDVDVAFCKSQENFEIEVFPGTNPDELSFKLTNCGDITAPWKYDYQNIQILDWFTVEPIKGMLEAGESVDISITVNSSDKPLGVVTQNLKFDSLMTGTGFTLPVTVNVTRDAELDGDVSPDGDTIVDGDDVEPDGDVVVDGDAVEPDGDDIDSDLNSGTDGDISEEDFEINEDEEESVVTDGDQSTGSGDGCRGVGSMNPVIFLLLGLLFAIRQSRKGKGKHEKTNYSAYITDSGIQP